MAKEPEDTKDTRTDVPDETASIDTSPETLPSPKSDLPMKKQNSKKKWFTLLLVVVLIAAVAGVVYYFVSANKTAEEEKKAAEANAATRFASPQALVDKVTPELRGSTLDITESNGQGGKTSDGFGAYGVPSYKVGDRKYSNLPTASSGTGYLGDSVQASKNYSTLVSFFKDNKFKVVSSGKDANGPIRWLDQEITYVSYATYESSNLLCMIWHADASGTALGNHVTSVGCAEKTSYTKAAEALDPYFAAYTKDEASPADKIVLGDARTGDSNTNGYKVAVLYQEDPSQLDTQFDGLYYKAPGQNEWTYFMGTAGWLDCTEFNTDTLKKAFDGFNCYDKASDTIINVGTGTLAPELK